MCLQNIDRTLYKLHLKLKLLHGELLCFNAQKFLARFCTQFLINRVWLMIGSRYLLSSKQIFHLWHGHRLGKRKRNHLHLIFFQSPLDDYIIYLINKLFFKLVNRNLVEELYFID